MQANASWNKRLGFACAGAILVIPILTHGAQPAKAPAAKAGPAKAAPIDDNGTWLLAGPGRRMRAVVDSGKKGRCSSKESKARCN